MQDVVPVEPFALAIWSSVNRAIEGSLTSVRFADVVDTYETRIKSCDGVVAAEKRGRVDGSEVMRS